ncbi:MAG TPA: hypothetical protein PLP48_03970 [Acholeplasmataceae bacterium]|nr:hypothetical protein [Acholeplasmataceae bacterium]
MKRASKANVLAIFAIIAVFVFFGIKEGSTILSALQPILNLPSIAFSGFIAFFVAGLIMRASDQFLGIWFGVKGGAVLYAICFSLIEFVIF